jgi:hypothetical protein
MTENDAGPGSLHRLPDIHIAEVLEAIRRGVRGEPALRVNEDEGDNCEIPGVGDRSIQPVGASRNLEPKSGS